MYVHQPKVHVCSNHACILDVYSNHTHLRCIYTAVCILLRLHWLGCVVEWSVEFVGPSSKLLLNLHHLCMYGKDT